MIIAIDIGGTKTLVASSTQDGEVIEKIKFPSPKDYQEYLKILVDNINSIHPKEVTIISIGCAGVIDRSKGVIINSPNLGWQNIPLVSDLKKIYNVPIIIENDANLAGLSEAHGLGNLNQKVLYVTFSTGIGTGFIVDGKLEPYLIESEGGRMVFEHEGKLMNWESFASGKTIVAEYGKMASELEDPEAWQKIAKNMALGIVNNCAVFMPDTIVIGGGVGTYFNKYSNYLTSEMDKLLLVAGVIKKPIIIGAKNAEEAVMLGCIIAAKQYE